MSDIILHTDQLSKTFVQSTAAAVHQVSLQVTQGEVLALTGPSGAGKTTLLRLLAGLMLPDQGTVYYKDELVNEYAEELVPGHPDIHLVFQDFKLFPNHTVAENINYQLRYYDQATQQQRTEELLQIFHLQAFAKKYPRELSGGQQQRVALAKALSAEPEILLLDEPFSQIDGILKQEIKQALKQLVNRYNTTLVFVTHDTQDALSFTDKVALIQGGQLIQTASPEDMYHKPTNQFVARFFGLCNVFNSQLLPKGFIKNNDADQTVCIRPEQLKVTKAKKAHLSGQVIQQQFMGNHYLLQVQSNDGLSLWVYSLAPFKPSTTIHLSITDWWTLPNEPLVKKK
ncbi:ABC transporter ATP-binding protein [Microscilla marina]|uniref:ATPase FbpC n=1 Tax=Microscilla marina ATCC 23134 TaxID=313606 RepID=A1ZE55_MICM2|nr:ABC transporter ATP-binding protein [Microscilla marina]EAY31363.1 ATPase FbpC [Microscilla marina ATCC 23134]